MECGVCEGTGTLYEINYRTRSKVDIGTLLFRWRWGDWNNQKEILLDETAYYPTKSGEWKNIEKAGSSMLSIKNSTVMGGYIGENISIKKPDFIKLMPAFIYNLFSDKLNE